MNHYVDIRDARNPFDFIKMSSEFLIDHNKFLPFQSYQARIQCYGYLNGVVPVSCF